MNLQQKMENWDNDFSDLSMCRMFMDDHRNLIHSGWTVMRGDQD